MGLLELPVEFCALNMHELGPRVCDIENRNLVLGLNLGASRYPIYLLDIRRQRDSMHVKAWSHNFDTCSI